MVYGGTIKPGYSSITSKPIDVVSAFQSYGEALLPPGHCRGNLHNEHIKS